VRREWAAVLLGAALAWGGFGCGPRDERAPPATGAPEEPAPLHVVATIEPLAWFVERLAGEHASVEVVIPPGADPHTFEPAPRQLQALAGAQLVVQVGHGALPFEENVVEQVRRLSPAALFVALADPGQRTAEDPHLWVDPEAVRPLAAAIAHSLVELDPAAAASYRARLASLEEELDALDAELRSILAAARGRAFVVHHPTWGAFAQRYGLVQLALEHEGKEPGPRRLAALIEEARARGVEVVLVQRGFSDKAARTAARQIGAVVVEVDPLARDWPESLRQAARAVAGANQGVAAAEPGQ
jgi:zinc transport system substrate-binding protein